MHPIRFLILGTALAAAPAFAQDVPATPPPPPPPVEGNADSITIGGAVGYLPDYEGSNDYQFSPIPGAIGSYKGYAFTLAGNRASVDLVPNAPGPGWDVQAGPVGVVNFNRTFLGQIDDVRIKALGKVPLAIELGGFVGIGRTGVITSDYDRLSVSVSYRYDVTGVHKSGILQPSATYITPLSRKLAVGMFASGERVEDGYARRYFTVNAGQALASGLPAYTARGGWKSYTLGALATVSITGDLLKGFKVVGGGTYRRMLNDFADTPIVSVAGDRNQWMGALGLAYTF